MTKAKIAKSLAVRSPSGAINAPTKCAREWRASDGAAISNDDIVAAALEITAARVARGNPISDPGSAKQYLRVRFGDMEHEVFACLWLDNRHRVIACDEMFRGTIDSATVHAREIVKQAMIRNAAAVILVHNHPSGVAEPSAADQMLTTQLKGALQVVGVRTLDHMIVAGGSIVSFESRGMI